MLQRRDLVHPLAIVMLVVIVLFDARPAAGGQRSFGTRDRGTRHQDVDVAEQSAGSGGQAGRNVGRAFEQNHGMRNSAERGADMAQFAHHVLAVFTREDVGGVEMRLGA